MQKQSYQEPDNYLSHRAEEEAELTPEVYEEVFWNTFTSTDQEEYLPSEEDLEAMYREYEAMEEGEEEGVQVWMR